MSEINRRQLCDGVYFSNIKDEKFKTSRISVNFFVPLNPKTASANALLPNVLSHSCKKYPDYIQLNRHLAGLYGSALYSFTRKVGDAQVITLSVVGINDRYALNGESISAQLSELLVELLFYPKVLNNSFCEEDVKIEKFQLLDTIDAEYNDKRSYAIAKMLSKMCENETFGTRYYGTRNQVEALTSEELYSAWQNLLETSVVEIMMLGQGDEKTVSQKFCNEFSKIKRNVPEITTQVVESCEKVTEFSQEDDLAQSKLVMGFRTKIADPDEKADAVKLMTAVLGGTFSSKFFLNIREKMSLCYYCAARYFKKNGIMIVDSGIENCNIEKTKAEVLNQISLLANGDLSDKELNEVKMYAANNLRSVYDTQDGIESWYLSQLNSKEVFSPEESAEKMFALTKEDVIEAAKMLTLDTVFILKGKSDNQQN